MELLSRYSNDNRESFVYMNDSEYIVIYREDESVYAEKKFVREWEAENSAENFVYGYVF